MRGKRVVVVLVAVAVIAAAGARLLSRGAPPRGPDRPPAAGPPDRGASGGGEAPGGGAPLPEAAIRVSVVDGSGRPVAGAEVVATRDGDPRPARAIADDAGRASLAGLEPGVDWIVGARAPEYAPTLIPGVRVGDLVQAVLTPGLRVHGTVRLRDGRACGGARVRIALRIPGSSRPPGGFETNADATGAYEFLRMPIVPFELRADWKGSASRPRPFEPAPDAAEQRADLVVDEGEVVSGTVRDGAGRPLPGIRVVARRSGGRAYHAEAETGEDGGFVLGGLEPTDHSVDALDTSGRRRPASIAGVIPPRTGLDFALEDDPAAPGTYAFRLIDPSGRPIRTLRVAEFRPGREEPTGSGEDGPDADGLVRSAQHRAGTLRIHVRAEGGFADAGPFEIRPAGETDLGTLELTPGASVRGRVLAPDGSPAVRARIFVGLEHLPERGQPDVSGRFGVRGLAPPDGLLRIVHPGCEVLLLPWQAAAGATADLPDARLARARGTVRGRVRAASGTIPAGAVATLDHDGGIALRELRQSVPVGPDGGFEFREVPAGRWRVSALVPDRTQEDAGKGPTPMLGRSGSAFDLEEGGSTEVEVVLD